MPRKARNKRIIDLMRAGYTSTGKERRLCQCVKCGRFVCGDTGYRCEHQDEKGSIDVWPCRECVELARDMAAGII